MLDHLDKVSPLLIVGTLILQPLPIPGDTSDFLTVVVWYRVVDALSRWIYSISLDALIKSFVFLFGKMRNSIDQLSSNWLPAWKDHKDDHENPRE